MNNSRENSLRFPMLSFAGAVSAALMSALCNVSPATAGPVTDVRIVPGANATQTSSVGFVNVPGAVTRISVPAGTRATLLTRFTAESACSGGEGSNYCRVRILINGVEATPVVGTDFAFDSTNSGNETGTSWESHSVERFRRALPAGNYTVVVQYSTTNASTVFRVDDWLLTVERIQEP